MKILIVDDVTQMRIKTKMLLNSLGYEDVQDSSNGVQAIEEMGKTGPYDVVFMDWNMPEMSGIETLRKIKTNSKHIGVKIVFLTSMGKRAEVLQAIASGADSYIVKPVTAPTLEKCLASL